MAGVAHGLIQLLGDLLVKYLHTLLNKTRWFKSPCHELENSLLLWPFSIVMSLAGRVFMVSHGFTPMFCPSTFGLSDEEPGLSEMGFGDAGNPMYGRT